MVTTRLPALFACVTLLPFAFERKARLWSAGVLSVEATYSSASPGVLGDLLNKNTHAWRNLTRECPPEVIVIEVSDESGPKVVIAKSTVARRCSPIIITSAQLSTKNPGHDPMGTHMCPRDGV